MGMAGDDGACTPKLIEAMVRLAQGGVGLIVTAHAHVLKGSQTGPWQMGCHDDGMLPGLYEMTEGVHAAGGVIALQIAHGGILAHPELSGEEPLGPSALQTENGPVGRAMTTGERQGTIEAFAAAASRAVQSGFDGVQVYSAWLSVEPVLVALSQQEERRVRRLCQKQGPRASAQVLKAVQDAAGDGCPVFVKMNSEDLLDGGLSKEDMVEVCAMLHRPGIDAIELSGGTTLAVRAGKIELSFAPTKKRTVYWREAAEQYQRKVDVPPMLVGGRAGGVIQWSDTQRSERGGTWPSIWLLTRWAKS
jgi:2,4-dienoyl-CoA reductase-like NADH-dependent reductase (Old Yellow Enzyme family)